MKSLWIFTSIFIVAFAALLGIWRFGGVPFVSDVPAAATKLVASLLIVTLFTERSLAAINAAVFGGKQKLYESKIRDLDIGLELGTLQPVNAQADAKIYRTNLAVLAGQEEKVRIAIGFAFAVLISAAGVRTLSALVMIDGLEDGTQKNLAHMVDILLTAGLIAGGGNGLAELLQLMKQGLKPPSKLL